MNKIDFTNPSYYENRELSWIKFDESLGGSKRQEYSPA